MPYIVYSEEPKATGRTLTGAFTDPTTGQYYAEVNRVRQKDVECAGDVYLAALKRYSSAVVEAKETPE